MKLKQSVVAITAAIRHHADGEKAKEVCTAFPPYMSWEPEALYRHYLAEVGDPMSAMVSALLFPTDLVNKAADSWSVRLTDYPFGKSERTFYLDTEADMTSVSYPSLGGNWLLDADGDSLVKKRADRRPFVNVGTIGHCNQAPVKFKGNRHIML